MIRVFLDANVLFSAAYREGNGILRLWELSGIHLVTSSYAVEEAERNIARKRPSASKCLRDLACHVEVSPASRPCAKLTGCRRKTCRSSR